MNAFIYDKYSKSIRQMPQNYLIAHKEHGAWKCEPDLAADIDFCTRVFSTVHHSYANKYMATGEQIIEMAHKLNRREVQP